MPDGLFILSSIVKLNELPRSISWRELELEERTKVVRLADNPPKSFNPVIESCFISRK